MIYIYSLKDPRDDDTIKYIGKTNNTKSRLAQHKCQWKRSKVNSKLNSWIKSLAGEGLIPLMEIIDECEDSMWQSYEIGYILLLKACGANLKNATNGGNSHSINTKSIESLSKRRETLKGRKRPNQSKIIKDLHEKGVYKNFGFKKYSEEDFKILKDRRSQTIREKCKSGEMLPGLRKKVERVNIETGQSECAFDTVKEAAKLSNCSPRYIWKCLNRYEPNVGKKKGFIFREISE